MVKAAGVIADVRVGATKSVGVIIMLEGDTEIFPCTLCRKPLPINLLGKALGGETGLRRTQN